MRFPKIGDYGFAEPFYLYSYRVAHSCPYDYSAYFNPIENYCVFPRQAATPAHSLRIIVKRRSRETES